MNDTESILVAYLSKYLDVPVAADVPEIRPDRFVSLERTGGSFDQIVVDHPTLAVQCWGLSRSDAKNLAYKVDSLVRMIPDEIHNIAYVSRNSLYNFPDDKQARYQIVFDFTIQQ